MFDSALELESEAGADMGSGSGVDSRAGSSTRPHSVRSALGIRVPVTLHMRTGDARATAHGLLLISERSSGVGRRFLRCRRARPGFGFVMSGDWGRSCDKRLVEPVLDALS